MSGSLFLNTASMTALYNLRSIYKKMEATQNRISTGLRISQASDNIAYYSIANNMRDDNIVLSTVFDGIKMAQNIFSQAADANTRIRNELQNLKKDVALAENNAADSNRIKNIRRDILATIQNIKGAISNTYVDGQSLFISNQPIGDDPKPNPSPKPQPYHPTLDDKFVFISSFRRVNGSVVIDHIEFDKADLRYASMGPNGLDYSTGLLKDLFDSKKNIFLDDKNFTDPKNLPMAADYTKVIDLVNNCTNIVDNVDAILVSGKQQFEGQIDFLHKLQDNLTKSVSALVDADMDAESAKVSALQVQQQLAVQALAMANQSTQHILALYRN